MKRILMGIALVPCMALATTWYVDGTSGTDENSGTSPAEAKATIQAAIDVSADNDTILVAPGTYAPIATSNKLITIVGVDGCNKTIIDGMRKTRCVNCVVETEKTIRPYTNTVVSGFTLMNGFCDYNNGGRSGQFGGGVMQGRYDGCIIKNCHVENGGGGAGCGAYFYNCLLSNNSALNGGAAESCALINCTVAGNTAQGTGSAGWDCAYINCIVYSNGWNDIHYAGDDIGSPASTLGYVQKNVVKSDPGFVDAKNGDYRLASDSPCIDAGDNSYVVGDADLDGSERIVNGKVDIGCYEYGSVGGPYVEKVGETNWTYMIKNGKASVGDDKNSAVTNTIAGAVTIPNTLGGRPVTEIGWEAFGLCTNMTAVTIPASVKTIGDSAFEGCDKLADVYFEGETMSAIGVDAFRGCHWDLIMHVPADWQGRGRTLCGYSVWRVGSSDEEKSVNLTTTNVVVQYVLNSVQPEIAVPVSGDTGFVAVITEVTSSGAVSVPSEWKANYPQYEAKFGTDFGKSLMAKSGKRDCANNEMLVWQDYVAGTDPTDENSKFTASITMVEGVPVISYSPELTAEQAALRTYKTWGKKQLGDTAWTDLTDASGETLKAYNFFKVSVEMK